jgi:uncharacterized SAM-binding protein YcdF (DUF218 family)
MNELLSSLGLSGLKPLVTALLLPPVPWVALLFIAVLAAARRRALGVALAGLGAGLMWFSGSAAVGEALGSWLLQPPPALGDADIARLRRDAAAQPGRTAIVVLGGGREALAPEYGVSNLTPGAMQRLRYGLWLSRATQLPVAFSGGVGHAGRSEASQAEASEAGTAARIAEREFRQPLRWVESQSRDTRENAAYTLALLAPQGVQTVVVVTDGWHMPRSLRAFREAAGPRGVKVIAAPMGMGVAVDHPVLRWAPSNEGLVRVRNVMREWLGTRAGA